MFASRVELTKGPRNLRSIIIPSKTTLSFIFTKNWADQGHFINLNSIDFEGIRKKVGMEKGSN